MLAPTGHLLSVANGSATAYKILFSSCKAPLGRERESECLCDRADFLVQLAEIQQRSPIHFTPRGVSPRDDRPLRVYLAELRECQTLFPFASQFAKCFARCDAAAVRVLLIMDAPCVRARCVSNVIIHKRCMPLVKKVTREHAGFEIDTLLQTLRNFQSNRPFWSCRPRPVFFWVCGRAESSHLLTRHLCKEKLDSNGKSFKPLALWYKCGVNEKSVTRAGHATNWTLAGSKMGRVPRRRFGVTIKLMSREGVFSLHAH
jgi:hypothetical protein